MHNEERKIYNHQAGITALSIATWSEVNILYNIQQSRTEPTYKLHMGKERQKQISKDLIVSQAMGKWPFSHCKCQKQTGHKMAIRTSRYNVNKANE